MKVINRSIVWILLVPAGALAQETNLWNEQYGTRSTLLGGSVIGSVTDLSATFYNPGAIALFGNASVLLSARGYEYSLQSIEGAAGEGRDLKSSSIRPLPDLVASSLPFDWLGKQSLTFSVLVRKRIETDIQARGAVPPLTTGGQAAREFTATNNLSEIWGGLTWSTGITGSVGFGLTTYLAIRDQEHRIQLLSEELEQGGSVATSIYIRDFTYQHYRVLWKAGVAADFDPLKVGVTVTTPGVGVAGSGSILGNVASSGFDFDGDGQDDDFLAGAYRDNLPAEYRSSWSYGIGGSYGFGDVRLHFSGEFIDGVGLYELLGTGDFAAQSSGDTISLNLTHETMGIFNYAIGTEYKFNEKTTGYVSYSSDRSAAIPGSVTTLSVANYDVHHIGAGAAFTVARWDLVVGGVYSFGRDKISSAIRLPDQANYAELLDQLKDSDIVFRRIRVLFGFSFTL